MNAVLFIILRQYRNRIKQVFSRPLSAVLTTIACVFFISGPVIAFLIPRKGLDVGGMMEVIIAGIQLFIGLVLINAFLSQQSGLFTLADTNFLFSAPLNRSTVLAYAMIQTGPASLLTAVFMTFYFPFVIGDAMSLLDFLATILIMTLMFGCIYISYYYVYIIDIEHPGLKKRLKGIVWIIFLIIAAGFIVILADNDFSFARASESFFTSPFYNALPVFGWAKWGIAAAVKGEYLTGFLPAVLLLSACIAVFVKAIYSSDVDFYEQAQHDSVRVQELMDNVKSGNLDARKVQTTKIREAGINFKEGAAAIWSRQILELKKSGSFVTFRELLMGLAYVAIGKVAGLDYSFVIVMIVFSALSASTNDTWNADFKKPYVFLIPESSFKKVIYSVLPNLIKSLIMGFISLVVASAVYIIPIFDAVGSIVIFSSYVILFISAEVFTYRILGKQTSAVTLMFLRMLFLIVASIPASVMIIVIAAVSGGSASIPLITAVSAAVNVVESCILAYLSRKLFEQSELMG